MKFQNDFLRATEDIKDMKFQEGRRNGVVRQRTINDDREEKWRIIKRNRQRPNAEKIRETMIERNRQRPNAKKIRDTKRS